MEWFVCKVFEKDLFDTRVIQSHIIFAQWKTNMFMRYVCIDENSYLHSSIVKNHKHIYDRYRFQMKELREISLCLDYYHAKFICFCCRETFDVLLYTKSCTKSFILSIAFTFQLMTLFCTYLALCSYGGYGGLSYSI